MFGSIISLSDTASVVSEKAENAGQALGYGGSVTLLGVSIVFLALVALIIITWLYPKIIKGLLNKDKKKAPVPEKASQAVPEQTTKGAINDNELVAVITAAIAASLGTASNGIVIRSLRRSNSNAPAWGKEGRTEQVYNRF